MKAPVVAVVCLFVVIASGQWLETTIPVGITPKALCYNSVGNKVYCACSGSWTVAVIDGATNRVVANISTRYRPFGLCYNATDNKV